MYSITLSNKKLSHPNYKIRGSSEKTLIQSSVSHKIRFIFRTVAIPCLLFLLSSLPLLSQTPSTNNAISSESFVNWKNGIFFSDIQLDMDKAGFALPAGRNAATSRMQQQLPLLLKGPLLTMTIDSSTRLGDVVLWNLVSLENLTDIIDTGSKTPTVYGRINETLTMRHSISLNDLASLLLFHEDPYKPNAPIDQVSSRAYSGIIIDARGALPVHGEFVEARTEPCIFPKIWDETMDLLYELNMVEPEIVIESGIVTYSSSTDEKIYQDRIGIDPLRITARQVFGIYRTDPVISRNDALKILSVPENIDLLRQGKVVLLLDDDVLAYAIAAPLKDEAYYVVYQEIEDFIFTSKIKETVITDTPEGTVISVRDLKFIPDSAELLEIETPRLDVLAQSLLIATRENEYTILVEGHTASVGKLEGEQNLSVERAQAIIAEFVERGVDESLFTYRGYGGTIPIEDNATEKGRALNRRVEITIIPKATYIQRLY